MSMYHSVVEYKVRPLERYNLTRYEQIFDVSTGKELSGSCTTVGVFDNEDTANFVKEALENTVHKQWVVVEDGFDPKGLIYYRDSKEDAQSFKEQLESEHNKAFKIFTR